MLTRALVVPALAGLALALAACGDDTASDASGSPSSSSSGSASAPTGATTSCDYPSAGAPAKDVDAPAVEAPAEGTVSVTLDTSLGDVPLTLDQAKAPCTVHSFVSLAEQGYFDGTTCHRLTTEAAGIEVLQCGDPTGTGTGGPGYSFADELDGHESYTAGVVAMANAGPDTNGSQFFLVYADSTNLDSMPDYTIFGSIDPAGLELVADAAAQGTADGSPDGAPKVAVDIAGVTVS